MLYLAFIEIDKDNSASGWFPDVPGCVFAGDTPEEANQDAKSALEAHFELLTEQGLDIPPPHPQAQWGYHQAKSLLSSPADGVWLFVDINMDRFDGRAERINITLPHRLIYQIDTLVKSKPQYQSRSAFLADAARNALLKAD